MTRNELAAVARRLDDFLADLLAPMGRSERRRWAKIYVQGLLLDGERKSVEPMAGRIAGADLQSLRQFVGQSPWAVEEVQRLLAAKVVDVLSEPEVWMIDETSFPKAGEASVGVARQYCGALGKVANCQVAVSLHWSTAQMSCPLLWRLYLPKVWLEDATRRAAGKIPEGIEYQSKNELALALVDQALDWELPRLPVVADSAYGNDFDFRQALRQRGLSYAVAVEPTTKVWTNDPNQIPVPASKPTGRPRKYAPPAALPTPQDLAELARALPAKSWQTVTWRMGSQGPLRSRFAKVKIWAAHGWKAQRHPKRVPEWLLIEWPEGAESPSDYWLAELGPQPVGLRRLVRTARARWRVELDYRELKEELGLDHYEGRHWLGWHHHVTLVSLAFAFLRQEQSRLKKNFWCDAAADPPLPASGAD
jgi:SRSO17 transposase